MTSILSNSDFWGAFLLTSGMIIFGFVFRRKGIIVEGGKAAITAFLWKIALPCFAFSAFMTDFDADGFKTGGTVLLLAFAFYFAFLLIGKLVFRRFGKAKSTVSALMFSIGQLTLFSMPLLKSLDGSGESNTVLYAGIMTIAFRVMVYIVGGSLITGNAGSVSKSLKKIFLNPIMLGMLLGVAIWLAQGILPQVTVGAQSYAFLRIDKTLPSLYKAMSALTNTVSPLAMFLIGLTLGECDIKSALRDRQAWITSLMRTVVSPAAVLLLLTVIPTGLGSDAVTALVMGFAAPASITLTVFCVKAGVEEHYASTVSALSTLCCAFTIPAVYALTLLLTA